MAATASSSDSLVPRRLSIPLPRPLWIGLAAAVLIVASVALRFGLPIYRQQAAIRAIERVGGEVYLGRVEAEWIRAIIGEERATLLDPIDCVRFLPDKATFHRRWTGWNYSGPPPYVDGPTVDDMTLACVARIPKLQRLDLQWTNISDDGMRHLAGLHELRELEIDGTDVSDASVQVLLGLPNLETLSLKGTMITDAGIVALKPLTKLKRLSLDVLLLTPEVVQNLSELPHLEKLSTGGVDSGFSERILAAARRALPRVQIR